MLPETTSSSKTILIIDDTPANIGILVKNLNAFGFNVITADNGPDGVKMATDHKPDLILLDVMMPGMNGFQACEQLKENEVTASIPIIFITALSDIKSKIEGFKVGGVDYIEKPFHQGEILARVNTHLRLRELNEHLEQKVQERTDELNQAYHKLELLDKAKADFIDILSHELRTPVTGIAGYTQLLQDHIPIIEDADAQLLTTNILKNTQRLEETFEHILDANQITSKALQLLKTDLPLNLLIDEICREFEPTLAVRELTLTCQNLDNLWLTQGDSYLLYKTFYHIVINAIKYTPDGGKIEIIGNNIANNGQGPEIEVVVRDAGIGIDADQIELIFEKFYQTGEVLRYSSGKVSYKGGGPGLGLAIAKSVVEAHGGRIWAESGGYDEETFPGSQFYVRLPAKSDQA
ncbi:MAG: hybrid sensor histidine kinase/response regulator [Chloroflexota bacterium]